MENPLYNLTVHNPLLESLPFSTNSAEFNRGAVEQIFDDESTAVKLQRISIDCCVISSEIGSSRDTAFGNEYAAIKGQPVMIMSYTAFGTQKGWFGKTRNAIIAQRTMKVDPLAFGRLRASQEQYVDFAVSEAERLAKKHGLTIELSMYCHEVYVRKYMQNK